MDAGRHTRGFTLVELIVILVVAGFLGTVVVSLMSTQLTKSLTPLSTTQDAGVAEATMESIVAYYSTVVNNNTTSALDDVVAHYPNNATVTLTRSTFNGVDTLTVNATVGQTTLTTLLTQERRDADDTKASF